MQDEWHLANENGIQVSAVWMWIDKNYDQPGKLNKSNETVLKNIVDSKLKTQIWIGFHDNYFQDGTDVEKIQRGVEILEYLYERATKANCKVAFYNHGGWIGEPTNQVKIIQAAKIEDVGIIYNFHHAHDQLDRFQSNMELMKPYLWAVNLNG